MKFFKALFEYIDKSHRFWFLILSLCAVGLLLASFLMPPAGVIDASVIAGVGELFAFASLGTLLDAIHQGKKATVRKGSMELSIDGNEHEN